MIAFDAANDGWPIFSFSLETHGSSKDKCLGYPESAQGRFASSLVDLVARSRFAQLFGHGWEDVGNAATGGERKF